MSFSKGLLLNSLHTVPLATVATALGCVPVQPSLGSSVSLWSRLHRVAVSAYVRLLLEGFRSGRGDWMLEAEGRLWCMDWGREREVGPSPTHTLRDAPEILGAPKMSQLHVGGGGGGAQGVGCGQVSPPEDSRGEAKSFLGMWWETQRD